MTAGATPGNEGGHGGDEDDAVEDRRQDSASRSGTTFGRHQYGQKNDEGQTDEDGKKGRIPTHPDTHVHTDTWLCGRICSIFNSHAAQDGARQLGPFVTNKGTFRR